MKFFRNEINVEKNRTNTNLIEIENTNVVQSETLNISFTPVKKQSILKLYGHRIIDIAFIFKQIAETDHKPFNCSFKDMICINKTSIGLISSYIFVCNFCKIKKTNFSENKTKTQMMDLNTAAVAGNINVGAGYSQLETITASSRYTSYDAFYLQ